MGPSPQENLSMIPVNNAQNQQSQQTQAGVAQTGADLLTSMTQSRLNSLYQTQDKLNAEIMKVSGAATTPVPVSGTQAINLPGQHQWQNIPNDNRTTYSRSGANKVGIANAIRGVANVVGALETKHQNDKNKALAVDIERLMEAHQGVQSAQEVLQQDPNNKDAKATLDKNQQIMEALLSDPKKRKQIGKAFDINFVDPSQNNKPEHASLKQAVESYTQQFQKKLPAQMAPNVLAQQKLGQLQETGKLIDEQIKAINSNRTVDAYLRYQTEQDKLEQRRNEEADKKEHWSQQLIQRSQQFQQRLQQQAQNARLAANTRLGATQIMANARLAAVDKTIQGRIQYARTNGANDVQMARVVQMGIKNYQDQLDKSATVILQAQTLYNDPKASPQDKEAAQKQINETEENQGYIRDQIRDLQNQFVLLTGNQFRGLGDSGDGTGSTDYTTDSTIPSVVNPNGARQHSTTSDKPQAKTDSKPSVQTTGPKEDTNTDQQYLDIIKQNLSQQ